MTEIEFRRAGGFLGGKDFREEVPRLLRQHDIKIFIGEGHNDCGAKKLVQSSANGNKRVDRQTYEAIVLPYLKNSIQDPKRLTSNDIEDISRNLQQDILVTFKHDAFLQQVYYRKKHTVGEVNGRKTLLIMPPVIVDSQMNTATVKCMDPRCTEPGSASESIAINLGLDPKSTYIVTPTRGGLRDMKLDAELAVRYIGIPDVVVYSGRKFDPAIEVFWNAIKRNEVTFPYANVKRVG